MRKIALLVVLVSILAGHGHAQPASNSPSYSIRALRMQRSGNTLTVTGEVVITINGIEIRTDRAVVTLPAETGR